MTLVRLLTASLRELISEEVARLAAKGEFGRAADHIGEIRDGTVPQHPPVALRRVVGLKSIMLALSMPLMGYFADEIIVVSKPFAGYRCVTRVTSEHSKREIAAQ